MFKQRRTTVRRQTFAALSIVALSLFIGSTAQAQNAPAANKAKLASLSVSGPFKSGNLSVYLVHGKDTAPNQKLITLSEGLASKKLVVHETGSVNELSVENKGDVAVFIQSGEIVKGGQQDRTLQYDMVVPPKSGKLPIKSFCVEAGRWTQRGNEEKSKFAGSPNMVASKSLKMAAKSYKDQSRVWQEVDALQGKFDKKAAEKKVVGSSKAAASPSSLQLTLESGPVKKLSETYVKDLDPIAKNKSDVIGYAFAINGKINSVDVYSSHDLFQRLWPKLVKASAQEAAAENEEGKKFEAPTKETVQDYIDKQATAGTETKENPGGRIVVIKRESPKNLYFETRNKVAGKDDLWIHKNYLTK